MNLLRTYLRELEIDINKGEDTTLSEFTIVNSLWVRPEFSLQNFFREMFAKPKEDGFYMLPNGSRLLIDQSLEGRIKEQSNLPIMYKPDWQERNYRIGKTNTEGQNDFQIISVFDFRRQNFLDEIAVTAAYLIHEDMADRGPLYQLAVSGQENLNLGYLSPYEHQLKLVFLERKKPEEGKPREYHIHESDAPRTYKKKNRHFLAPVHEE